MSAFKKILFFVVFVTIFSLVGNVLAASPTMLESDEPINGFNPLSGFGEIYARSPFRSNGYDDFVTINSPFDEPRGYECHHGVDLSAWEGRPVFCVYSASSNVVKEVGYYSGYGNKVVIQHDLGNNYSFQSLYAHLKNATVHVGEYVTSNTMVGSAGHSGTSATHLHLEFPCSTKDSFQGNRSYAPSVFYYYVTSHNNWGLNTSFINHLKSDENNVIKFRISSMDCGRIVDVPTEMVKLVYRVRDGHYGAWTGWQSHSMNKNGNIFTVNVRDDLGLFGLFDLEYYISAKTDSFDGTLKGPAYRPYRYDFNAPADRPFCQSYYVNNLGKDLSNPSEGCSSYENPPMIEKEPLYVYATITKKTANGYVYYDNKNKKSFVLNGIELNPDVADFLMKTHAKFYVSVVPEKSPGIYTVNKDSSGNYDIRITENGIFTKEITPDLFVFKTDNGLKLQISGMKKAGIDETCIKKKCRFRVSCKIGNNDIRKGLPVFECIGVKPLDED